jgi:hypothetical protein
MKPRLGTSYVCSKVKLLLPIAKSTFVQSLAFFGNLDMSLEAIGKTLKVPYLDFLFPTKLKSVAEN